MNLMKLALASCVATLTCGAVGCAHRPASDVTSGQVSAPALVTLEPAALARARLRLQNGDRALQAPFAALKRRADQALLTPPRSVTHKTTTPPSGSKNDYMSMGPYWWPNPAMPTGLPYVQRDGQRNPQSIGDALDSARIQAMLADTRDLALAHHFTGDTRYAHKAAAVIRTWFLDTATRMNPNLRYGQAIPGIVEGRGIGIIDTRDLWIVIDAVALIAPAGLDAAEVEALRQWFAEYADWMDTSTLGRDEAAARNNHGMFFDAQLAAYWLFVGEAARARKLVSEARARRFAAQFDAEGRMPLELARTRPFHYHTFTLEAATRLARYGDVLGVDLWHAVIEGKSLRAVLQWVAATVVDPASWRHATALEPAPPLAPALPVLLIAQRAYPESRFDAALTALKPIAPDHVAWLMWPVP